MPDALIRRSALDNFYQAGYFGDIKNNKPGVIFNECRSLSITQLSFWKEITHDTIRKIEQSTGIIISNDPCQASESSCSSAIWIAPYRWLIVEKEKRDVIQELNNCLQADSFVATDLSHSRCVINISGKEARNVLRKGCSLDLDENFFKAGEAKTTSLFHINALIHCLAENSFDIYVARSYGQSFFEVIQHAAAEYGYRVTEPI